MKKVRIGVVGLGRMGKIHARNVFNNLPDAHLVAVCSEENDHLSWTGENLPGVIFYSSLADMLSETLMDAIILATPSRLHPEHLLTALQKGLDVFCEKPVATDQEGLIICKEILTKKLNRVIQVGFMRRYDASYLQAKKILDSGKIGTPILYRGYSADAVKFIETSLRFASYSDGQFMDMAIHDIDLMRWFLTSEPVSVTASGGSYLYDVYEKLHDGDNVAAFFQMQNKSMAFLYAGRTAAHGYQVETELICTNGSLRIGGLPNADLVEVFDSNGRNQIYAQDFEERFQPAFLRELDYFVQTVKEQKVNESNLNDAIRASEIALMATRSFREKKMILF